MKQQLSLWRSLCWCRCYCRVDRCSGKRTRRAACTTHCACVQSGYWRSSNQSNVFYRCIRLAYCTGGPAGALCAANREGPLCSQCEAGYYTAPTSAVCSSCQSHSTSIGVSFLTILLIVAAVVLLYWFVLRNPSLGVSAIDDGKKRAEPPSTKQLLGQSLDSQRSSTALHLGVDSATRLKPRGWDIDEMLVLMDEERAGRINKFETDHSIRAARAAQTTVLTAEARSQPTVTFALKIILTFFQITTSVGALANVPFPAAYVSFISSFAFVKLDIVPWGSLQCVTK